MPGMNSGIDVSDPAVVAAFKAALVHQGLIALLIFAVLGLAWVTVRTWTPTATGAGGSARHARPGAGRARLAAAAAHRLRRAVDLRRDLAGPAEDGGRAPVAGHRADRGQLTAVGAAGGELGRDELVVSPDAGRRLRGVDPGRDRHLAAGRGARPVVPAGRAGQRRLGAGGMGVRRVVRRDLRPGPDLAVRRARGGAPLLRGGRADRAAGPGLAHPAAGQADDWPGSGCSWWARRCCKPGRAAGSGRARPAARRARSPAWSPRWPAPRSPASCPAGWRASAPSPPRTGSRSTWSPWRRWR